VYIKDEKKNLDELRNQVRQRTGRRARLKRR